MNTDEPTRIRTLSRTQSNEESLCEQDTCSTHLIFQFTRLIGRQLMLHKLLRRGGFKVYMQISSPALISGSLTLCAACNQVIKLPTVRGTLITCCIMSTFMVNKALVMLNCRCFVFHHTYCCIKITFTDP